MRKGEHVHGSVQPIENRQVLAGCECGWSERISFGPNQADKYESKQEALVVGNRKLSEHQAHYNQDPDQGVRL